MWSTRRIIVWCLQVLLPRVLSILFERGVAVVLTSNYPPRFLYSHGLNRDRSAEHTQPRRQECN